MKDKPSLPSLRNFNIVIGILHLLQAMAMLYLSKNFKLPINVGFLNFDITTQTLVPQVQQIFELPLVWLVAGFLLLSSLAHILISTVYNSKYNADLEKGINRFRWFEYSISASTMMIAIAMLVGIYDLSSLLMIFSLSAVMNLMGLVMEVHNQTTSKTNWLSYNIGVFAGIIPWLVVGIFFWSANKYGTGNIPTFVYWIYVSIFIFFNSFAFNMVMQYRKVGAWSNYLFGERIYIVLSLVAKSALAWQVFAGTLRP